MTVKETEKENLKQALETEKNELVFDVFEWGKMKELGASDQICM